MRKTSERRDARECAREREGDFLEFHRETFSLDGTSVIYDWVNRETRRSIDQSAVRFLLIFFPSRSLPPHSLLHGNKFCSEDSVLFLSLR